jgi:hypothetical protein
MPAARRRLFHIVRTKWELPVDMYHSGNVYTLKTIIQFILVATHRRGYQKF